MLVRTQWRSHIPVGIIVTVIMSHKVQTLLSLGASGRVAICPLVLEVSVIYRPPVVVIMWLNRMWPQVRSEDSNNSREKISIGCEYYRFNDKSVFLKWVIFTVIVKIQVIIFEFLYISLYVFENLLHTQYKKI